MAQTLIDRIYVEMRESERVWGAEELCRSFLHMESSAALAGGLVRSILGKDSRFSESVPDQWSAERSVSTDQSLWNQTFRVYWIEVQGESISEWRLHTRVWTNGVLSEVELWSLDRPDSWLRGRRGEDRVPWMGYQPNLLRRVLVWADRNWATVEGELESIDLSRWCAVACLDERPDTPPSSEDLQLPRLAERWSLGPVEESPQGCLSLLAVLLERIRERFPEAARESLAAEYAEALEPRPIDWTRLGFDSSCLEDVPNEPGVYRFWSGEGELLYVGKSSNLSRRVRSYFRNFPATPTKRESLVYQIQTIECEPMPSELEALVRESEAIREEEPKFNVQIDVHPPNRFPRNWTWPLVYVPRSEHSSFVTVVGLSGQNRGRLLRLQTSDSILAPGERELLLSWCAHLLTEVEIPETDPPNVEALSAPVRKPPAPGTRPVPLRTSSEDLIFAPAETWLALRYYSRRHGEVDRIDPLAIRDPETLVDLVASLAEGRSEPSDRLVVR